MICIDNLKSVLVESENENKLTLRLHDAARKYDCKELKRLIQSGCDPNAQVGNTNETVLHLLVKDGFRGHLNLEKMEECLEYMVNIQNIHLDIPDKNGETPLTLAVANEFENCAFLMVKYGAKTTTSSPKFMGMSYLPLKIAQTMPNVMLEAFNSGISLELTSNGEPAKVKVDFSPLLQLESCEQKESSVEDKSMRRFKYHQRETSFLYGLLDVPPSIRVEYLNHPLVSAYLHLKKNAISKKLGWFIMLLGTYPIFYMTFIYFLYFDRCKFLRYDDSLPTSENNSTTEPPHKQMCYTSTPVSVAAYLLAIVAAGFALVEVYMQLRVDTKYLKNWRTWVIRVTLVIMAITLWPALQFGTMYDITWQYPIAALGTFFSWVMFLLQLELIPQVKIYLEMLVAITLSVLKITILFLPLLIGFYMGFHLMFYEIGGVMNFILMAVDSGSEEYDTIIERAKDNHEWFTIIAYTFSFSFLLLIAIVFMNFLLGVSINDIQELKRNAKVMALSNKVQQFFIIDLILPTWYNVTGSDMSQRVIKFGPLEDKSKLPENIRKDLTRLLKPTNKTSQEKHDSF